MNNIKDIKIYTTHCLTFLTSIKLYKCDKSFEIFFYPIKNRPNLRESHNLVGFSISSLICHNICIVNFILLIFFWLPDSQAEIIRKYLILKSCHCFPSFIYLEKGYNITKIAGDSGIRLNFCYKKKQK